MDLCSKQFEPVTCVGFLRTTEADQVESENSVIFLECRDIEVPVLEHPSVAMNEQDCRAVCLFRTVLPVSYFCGFTGFIFPQVILVLSGSFHVREGYG